MRRLSRSLPAAAVRAVACALALACCAVFAQTAAALPSEPGVGWQLTGRTLPTNLAPGGEGLLELDVYNVGKEASSGTITVTDTLPEGVTATRAGDLTGIGLAQEDEEEREGLVPQTMPIGHKLWACTGDGPGAAPHVLGASTVTCTNTPELSSFAGGGSLPDRFPESEEAGPNFAPPVGIAVKVGAGVSEGEAHVNSAAIAGGGAHSSASATDAIAVSAKPASSFGLPSLDAWFSNADGSLDTQAGSHPYAFTLNFALNSELVFGGHALYAAGRLEVRNIQAFLPPGIVGNPTVIPRCTVQQLNGGELCPNDTQIGIAKASVLGQSTLPFQVYNMVPPPGIPAEFGFSFVGVKTLLDSHVRSGGDYGITTDTNNIAQRELVAFAITLWGTPSDSSHLIWRNIRNGGCTPEEIAAHNTPQAESVCKPVSPRGPLLTLPTACAGPQSITLRANTWVHPEEWVEKSVTIHDSNQNATGFTGCEHLGFAPTITTSPDTANADTATGLTVEVKPPVGGLEDPTGTGTADIQNTTVTLPAGVVINPGQAAGLQACQPAQAHIGNENEEEPSCPLASKVGEVEIETPLLPHSLKGNVYVLQSNPPNLELLVAASGEGVNLKLVGKVSLCERAGEILDEKTCAEPGQLITRFAGTPELPFTDFKLSFSGGPQAALDTPAQCGTYESSADFTPWSTPFVPDFLTSASFGITAGPGAGACPSSPMPFAPAMTAGSTTDQAGGFTNFSLLLQRGDGQQRIEKLQFKAPAGLGGMLSSVPLCGEPQAAQGTCSVASRIGHASVASGPGPYPLVLPQPGAPELPIYLTGPYDGAPFGLSIVTPVIAGPFNLGTIVTRAKIEIDPHTAQITVTTDPLPQVVKGVPTDLRLVDSVIDRPGFMFNPTNCNPQEFSGTAWGTPPPGAGGPGASSPIGSHFGVGSCRGLEFAPKFSVTTSGRNSKANGASLTAKLAYPAAAQGTQANIGLVKVDLPKQLPSRLTTLQKACTLAQFEANPAGCPAASFIGHAVVHTPELPVPLTGPAIFVSHGGEAFPTLTMVLQGDGVTIDVVGSTFINKAGITSTTFKTVPDAPFSTFELTLPQGPNSALATNVPAKANYSLCGQKLTMPTEFVGQNGTVIHQTTHLNITGCAKTKTLTRAQKLARALKACHKKHNHAKRAACERTARKKYGPVKSKKSNKK